MRIALLIAIAALVVPATALAAPITRAQAERTARQAASEYLEMSGLPFGVRPRDWRVRCRREGRWHCRVRQGPCSGRFRIQRVTIGGGLRGIGRVACLAD